MFGGIGAHALAAVLTGQGLVGQNLDNADVLTSALRTLQTELIADHPPAAPSAAYRISVACALFYKFYLSFLPNANPRVKSGFGYAISSTGLHPICSMFTCLDVLCLLRVFGSSVYVCAPCLCVAAQPFVRGISRGWSAFSTDPSEYPVSQPIPKLTAILQTTGRTLYTDDQPILPTTLFAAFALSSIAQATLVSIDVSLALASPGLLILAVVIANRSRPSP